jgi:IMP dehydrogenase
MKNKKIIDGEGLTFDDLLLLPGYSDFKRDEVDLSVKLHPRLTLKLPIISSPMDTVTEKTMAIALGRAGGIGVIHRNLSVEEQVSQVKAVKKAGLLVGAAVGVGKDFEERVKKLVAAEIDLIVVDSAHGHSRFIIEAISFIKKKYPQLGLMAGNIATFDGARALIKAGVDVLRVGMGPGSICTTRIVTGIGVPQITAVMEAARACEGTKVTVIADGGIRQLGDIAKALGAGAAAVMLGSLLARFEESAGKIVEIEGKKYKSYRGMGSEAAMKEGSAARYGQEAEKRKARLVAEGVEGLVPLLGKVDDFLSQVEGALRSAFYYVGAKNIKAFHRQARFIKISPHSLWENHPHDVKIVNSGKSYIK